jgi:hypothetical protein
VRTAEWWRKRRERKRAKGNGVQHAAFPRGDR